jgi:hypothetical protein
MLWIIDNVNVDTCDWSGLICRDQSLILKFRLAPAFLSKNPDWSLVRTKHTSLEHQTYLDPTCILKEEGWTNFMSRMRNKEKIISYYKEIERDE